MTRKEFIFTLFKKYILPIIFISFVIYFGYVFYNENNKLEVIEGTLKFTLFAFGIILFIGLFRLLFYKFKFLNYIFYGIIISYIIYLFLNNFDFEKDIRKTITIIVFSILIEIYKLIIKKLDKITTNI